MTRGNLRVLAVLFLGCGLAVSGYLLFRSLVLAGDTAGGADVCSALFGKGCDATLQDPLSKQFGIPVAGWGVVHFAALLLLLLLGRLFDAGFRAVAGGGASILAVLGGLGSLALLFSLAVGAVPMCPLCIVANALNLLAAPLVLRFDGQTIGEHLRSWGRAIRYLLGAKVEDRIAGRWRVAGLVLVGLAAVVLYQWILIESDRANVAGKKVDVVKVLREYVASATVEVPVTERDPTLGPATAKATLVIFSDAFCPFCRAIWAGMPKFREPYADDLRIVFKHYPLEQQCNTAVAATLHPFACRAGLALEAARRQDAFWAYHEALNMLGPPVRGDTIRQAAERAGLDLGRFDKDMKDPTARAWFEECIRVGARLGLQATPSLFLNGKRVPDARREALRALVDHVLER